MTGSPYTAERSAEDWRALTMWQPWGALIVASDPRLRAVHYKTIESRRWSEDGPVLDVARRMVGRPFFIHAGMTLDPAALRQFTELGIHPLGGMPQGPSRAIVHRAHEARGAILGVATLDAVRRMEATPEDVRGAWSAGLSEGIVQAEVSALRMYRVDRRPFALVLRDVQALEQPVPCPGRQGFWRVERRHAERALEQLGRAA